MIDSILHRIHTVIGLALKSTRCSIPIRPRLLYETIAYEGTREREVSILNELLYHSQCKLHVFFQYARQRRHMTEKLVAHHLGLSSSICHAQDWQEWMHGSFNLCVPVSIERARRIIMRFPPMPDR